MGQQQLILLVLATVIVGVAIVVGIRAFTENDAKSNADAMTQDAVRMANDIQAWVKKPVPFGGPEAGESYGDAMFVDIGYADPDADGDYENLNGTFTLEGGGAGVGNRLIRGISLADDGTTVRNEVSVIVCGESDADIAGTVITLNEEATGAGDATCPGAAPAT